MKVGASPAQKGDRSLTPSTWWAGPLAAVGFLTILPVPPGLAQRGHRHATISFPSVGVGVGALAALVMQLPGERLVAATLAVIAMALVTGGLHWDGWADVMDASLANASQARRVEILADPRIGAHAAWGTAALFLLQALGLSRAPLWAVVLGPGVGRWIMVGTLRWMPPLAGSVAGASLRDDVHLLGSTVVLAGFATVIAATGPGPWPIAGAVGGAVLVAVGFARIVGWRLGGFNGDGHGATGLLAETSFWLIAAELAGL